MSFCIIYIYYLELQNYKCDLRHTHTQRNENINEQIVVLLRLRDLFLPVIKGKWCAIARAVQALNLNTDFEAAAFARRIPFEFFLGESFWNII